MTFPRVAVTGVGVVSALGHGAESTFSRLARGDRAIVPLTLFDALDARSRVAAEIPDLDVSAIAPRGERGWSRTDAMALVAAREALARSGHPPATLGVSVGTTTGGMFETEDALLDAPHAPLDPLRAKRLLEHPLDRTAQRLATVLGANVRATLCAACASGAIAIVRAVRWLTDGSAERVVAGGADGLCRLTFFGFDSLGALDPEPCRPFDRARRGLSLGEGAGFLVLELEATARRRGAEILAFLSGAAVAAEAHHITHPEPTGASAARLIDRALATARLRPDDIGYVNAHGTGTQPNDAMEAKALHLAFGSDTARVLVSSSKGQLGHTLGAAGAIEAAVTVLALGRGVAPPSAGLAEPEDPGLGHVMGEAKPAAIGAALSCSFGFGGTGAVLAFERADAPGRGGGATAAPRGRVVVTGFSTLGTGDNPLSRLDPERSRRFDRAAAYVAAGAEAALGSAGLSPSSIGLVAGSAFGSVERSVEFVRRALSRGVRRANPADFPHLVASGPSGNASIYLGLTGLVAGAVEGETSGEAALAAALSFLALFEADGLVVGAAEASDPIVNQVLGPLRRGGGTNEVPRGEGAAFLVVEREETARERRATVRAVVDPPRRAARGAPLDTFVEPPRRPDRALVVVGALGEDADGALAVSAWGAVERRSVLELAGFHEAIGALSLVAAVELVVRGEADEVLAVNGLGSETFLTRFSHPETERWVR